MTMPMEAEIEAREIPASHLLSVRCAGCGTRTHAIAEHVATARCLDCHRVDIDWTWAAPVGVWHPTVGDALVRCEVPVEVRSAYPAPEVSSRDVDAVVRQGVVWPGAVEKLASDGSALRWGVRKAWARGCLPHATTGRPGPSEDSYAACFARREPDGSQYFAAWAVHRGGAWKFVWMTGRDLPPFGLGGVTDLREWLADPGKPASWYDAIRERARLAEVRRKEAAKSRPKKGREAS